MTATLKTSVVCLLFTNDDAFVNLYVVSSLLLSCLRVKRKTLKKTYSSILSQTLYSSGENQPTPFYFRPFRMVKTLNIHLFNSHASHHFLSLLPNNSRLIQLLHSLMLIIQHSTPPFFISYSWLILYFCFYDYIKL